MKSDITREVVSDLWPLYRAGEASADTRRLIEAYLAADPEYRAFLEESDRMSKILPEMTLSPDNDVRLLEVARQRIRTNAWLVGAAIGAFVFVALVFIGACIFAFLYLRATQ